MEHENYLKKVLADLASFCAYQDRCSEDVLQKLNAYFLNEEEKEAIRSELEAEKYLDDGRFARSYARGKFNYKKWGKSKIVYGLKQKKLPDHLIAEALEEIPFDDYKAALYELLLKKTVSVKPDRKQKAKLYQFAVSKGFESDLIWECIDELNDRET